MSMTPILNRGMQRYIADSHSAHCWGCSRKTGWTWRSRVNIPGTSDQYKNWRRKLSTTLEKMFADDKVNKTA